ncbi:MAG: XRE family transcriptional regulator [Desulfitobacteriaceae bacterium]|nr:XRE family transcriptional regulator [Desulfitobacteriaceae bacterium]MDD4752402.1 XRE family transcriptional regulator [Desulfitobacteriaceae bacterium]
MNIGEKIKRLRVKNGLTQEELANRCELSKGFISQVERDLTSPSISTLVDILQSLGTNLQDFFNEAVAEKVVFRREDIFIKENREMKYDIEWIVPNSQKNQMEPIIISLDVGGTSQVDVPHPGEEFGFVLSGTVFIHLEKQKFRARKGESFYFKPSTTHFISNAGKTRARVLWISAPPSF